MEHPNHVWAIDFQFDSTFDGRMIEITNVVDEVTGEALTGRVGRTGTAPTSSGSRTGSRRTAGPPSHLRCDT